MEYLVGHYNPGPTDGRSGRLRYALASMDVIRADTYACRLVSELEPQPLADYLKAFLDPGEWFVLVRMTDGLRLDVECPA